MMYAQGNEQRNGYGTTKRHEATELRNFVVRFPASLANTYTSTYNANDLRNNELLMTIPELLKKLEPETDLMISNEPFAYSGKAKMTLDGGDERFWLFNADGWMLTIAPSDEELVYYRQVDEMLEPDGETVGYRGVDYEFSYEDAGTASETEGETAVELEERYRFADYESDEGERVRIVTNESTGESRSFVGSVISEDDVVRVE